MSGAEIPHHARGIHRDVSSGGIRLRVTDFHSATEPSFAHAPIVALPGLLAPRHSYRSLAEHLAPFRLIAVDFPGFGESEKPSPHRYPYGIPAFAEAIADLFGGLDLSQANVLGHGVGGAVALRLAAHHPELVKRLALIAPLAHPPRVGWRSKTLLAPMLGGLFFRQLLGKSWFFQIYRDRINPHISQAELSAHYESLAPPASRAALLATLRACQDGSSVIADCRRVRSPSLLVWGREDRMFPVETGRILSREMPRAGLEILGTAHAPHEESPEQTAKILVSFFSGNRAGNL